MVRAAAVNVHTARATPLPRGSAAANTWPLRVLMPASCTTPSLSDRPLVQVKTGSACGASLK